MSTIKFLKQEEKGRLFGSVDTDERRHAVRNRAIIYLAEYCGLRATEVCLLKMDDYDTLQSSIYCTRLKKAMTIQYESLTHACWLPSMII